MQLNNGSSFLMDGKYNLKVFEGYLQFRNKDRKTLCKITGKWIFENKLNFSGSIPLGDLFNLDTDFTNYKY